MGKIVLVTGGFDPLHSGHIEYFKAAKEMGDHLIVGVNSDEWLTRKKGRPFMSFEERTNIIKHLNMVDEVIGFNDDDDSACNAIFQVLSTKGTKWKVIFANGGDRLNTNTPEFSTYKDHPDVGFAWKVGGSMKMNSSSWILDEWKTQKTERDWGYWRVLDDKKKVKVKELVINPGCSLSDQHHEFRSEHWYVLDGQCTIDLETQSGKKETVILSAHGKHIIPIGMWHRAYNTTDESCHILEVQYGEKCVEDDIIRRDIIS